MAEGGSRNPRIRMPKVSRPSFGRSKEAKTTEADQDNGEQQPATDEKAATTSEAKTATPKAAGDKPKKPANLTERMEGLQGWMAEIERKQGRMTYFGAMGILIAIAASGLALYFGITAKNESAKKDDLDQLTAKVDSLQ